MPSQKISKDLNDGIYFLTFTIKKWYYIFDRYNRWEILLDSLEYCQKYKQLKIFSYVFMLNHIHLLVKSENVAGFVRDFKKHTSLQLMKNLETTEPTVAELFKDEDGKFSIWQKTNMPQLIETDKFFRQKKNYIEYNPVKKKYVENPEHWFYSSASKQNKLILSKVTDE